MLDTDGKPRLRLLLDHFALTEDDREPWQGWLIGPYAPGSETGTTSLLIASPGPSLPRAAFSPRPQSF